MPTNRTPLQVLLLLCAFAVSVAAAAPAPDPWPTSPVLTRLFTLPSGQADGQRLSRDLNLNAAQLQELRRLASSEAYYGQAGRRLFGRDEATRLNASIAKFNIEKDRKVKLALGDKYPGFRSWVKSWWAKQVAQAAPGH